MELVLFIPILAFVTVLLLALALATPKESTVQQRLRGYGYDPSKRAGGDLGLSFTDRVIKPFFRGIAQGILRLTPGGIIENARFRLRQARDPLSLNTFLMLRATLGLVLPGLYLLSAMQKGAGVKEYGITLVACYLGYRLPDIWLSFRIDNRREAITRGLPDALDLIVVCVEAGLSLEAAIDRVTRNTTGPLAEEFRQTLTEISLGRTRREALGDMAQRCGSSDLQTFIAAILQADQMGVSIADALRVQADAMRVRRRQRAEELIAKAPVKMLLPMIGFIFPALMVVLLGPAVIKIFELFRGMGS